MLFFQCSIPLFFREVHRLTWCSYVENWWSEFFSPGPTLEESSWYGCCKNFLLHLRGALNVFLKGKGEPGKTLYDTLLAELPYIYSLRQWPTSNNLRESLIFSRKQGSSFNFCFMVLAERLTLRSYAGFYWPLPKEDAIEKSKRQKKELQLIWPWNPLSFGVEGQAEALCRDWRKDAEGKLVTNQWMPHADASLDDMCFCWSCFHVCNMVAKMLTNRLWRYCLCGFDSFRWTYYRISTVFLVMILQKCILVRA